MDAAIEARCCAATWREPIFQSRAIARFDDCQLLSMP